MAEVERKSDLTVKEVLLRRGKKIEYTTVPTRQEGVSLRVETEGKKIPKLTLKALGDIALIGELFADRKTQIKSLEAQQDEPKKSILTMAYMKAGFRGIESIANKFKLTVTPTYTIAWNYFKLRKVLGAAYEAIVTESLKTEILIPLGRATDKGPLDGEMIIEEISNSLLGLGFKPDELANIVSFEQVAEVDETKLRDMVLANQLRTIGSAGKVALSFAIDGGPLK